MRPYIGNTDPIVLNFRDYIIKCEIFYGIRVFVAFETRNAQMIMFIDLPKALLVFVWSHCGSIYTQYVLSAFENS